MLLLILLLALALLVLGFTTTLKVLLWVALIAVIVYVVMGISGGRWY